MIFKTIDDNNSLSGQRIVSQFTARKIAQEEATKQLEIDIQCLRNYEAECQKGSVSTETFSNTMKGASIEAQKYATNIKNGTGSAQTFATNQRIIQTSMSETSIVSKVAATGLTIFKAALNSLIFFAVIEGIQLLIKGIDNLILTADEAEEKAEALRGNMQSFFDEVQSGQQTISSVSDRFSELSKHVTKTGENIDLTKDEYSEYLDICNQVKTIMPELVTGYTNEGNAIITLKDNVDSLTESYKKNIRTKAAAFITNGDDDGNTIQSFFDDYKIFTEGENGLFAPSAGGLWNNKSTDYEDYYGYDKVHEWLEDVADLSLKDLQNLQKGTTQATYLYALLKENGYELANITEDNYEAVHDVLDTRLTSLEGEMATRVSNVKMSFQQMLYADGDYWDIDDKEALSAIDSMFSSIDAEFIKQNNLLGQDALQSFESNVVKLFEDKGTQKAMIDIYTPQGDDEPIEDYSKRVNDAIANVQKYIKDNKLSISLDFGTEDNPKGIRESVDKLQKQYDEAINKFSSDAEAEKEKVRTELESFNKDDTIDFSIRPQIDTSELEKAGWGEQKPGTATVFSSTYYSEDFGLEEGEALVVTPILPDGTVLSPEQLDEYARKLLSGEKIDADIKMGLFDGENYKEDAEEFANKIHELHEKYFVNDSYFDLGKFFKDNSINTQEELDYWNKVTEGATSASQAVEMYNKAKQGETNETPALKSIPETVSDLEDLNKELDKLGTAMANIDKSGNFDLGDLDAVADYFLGLKDIPYNVTEVSNALKTLGDGTSTLEQQKDAINSLADEYLKTSGILDDLNESNAELIQLQLQRMGIENAEEIVNTSLQNEQAVLQQKAQLQQTLIDQGYQLINVTWAEIEAMQNEGIITQQNAKYLAALALQKQIQNGALDESANIANLQALAAQMGSTGSTISYWLGIIAHAGSASVADKARENATNAINEALNKFNNSFKVKVPKVKYNGGSPVANKLNKNNGSASNSKSKEQKSINEIDLFKRRVDVLNDALELLQKNLDNVTGYDAKNTLLNQSIAITQEEIKNYSDAVQMYYAKASDALSKVPEAYRDAAQNGKVELLTEEVLGSAADENDKTVKELVDNYTSWADSVADAKQKLAELKTELRQLELEKFKNIVDDYTDRTDIFENSQDLINKQIDLFKEAGQVIGEGFYTSLIDEENKKLSLFNEEKQKLIQEMSDGISNGTIEKGTDEWNEMIKSISEVNGSILDSKKAVEEFNNSIQQLHWDTIDRIKNDFSELSNEIEFLYNLLSDDEHVSDDFGNWSNNALAQLGLMAQSYEEHVYASQKLQNEIDNLTKAYKNGEYSETEYLEKLYDLKDEQRSEVEASEQAKDSIVSLAKARVDIMVNAINKEVDAMSDLIDKKKDALSAEKELHDYRQSIEESTKNIAKIEQQLAAMQGDDTTATIAKRKKLEEELANAKADLEEQEYSHSIDTQQDALDQQLQDFKDKKDAEIEYLKQYLENEEQVIYDAFELIKQNTETVSNSITMIAQDHGYQVSNTLTSSWQAGENAITSYNQAITDASSVFSQNLTTMQNAEWNLQQQANTTAISVASVYTASADNLLMQLTNSYVAESNLKQMTDALHDSLIKCLDSGYNIGSLTTQLHSVADAANSAANAVNNLMNSFAGSGNGTYQYGTGNTVYYIDDKGQKHVTSEAQAKKAGYTAPTSDRQDLIKNKKKKTSKKAKGGLITKKSSGSFDSIAESVGEDHIISVQDDEFVLTPVQTQAWLKLVDNLDSYNNLFKQNTSIIPHNIPLRDGLSNGSITLNYDHLIEVQGDVNNSNIKDIENAVSNSVNEQIKQFTTALKRVGVR